jgi:mannosidase alpha-like ER degradation enhancer 2
VPECAAALTNDPAGPYAARDVQPVADSPVAGLDPGDPMTAKRLLVLVSLLALAAAGLAYRYLPGLRDLPALHWPETGPALAERARTEFVHAWDGFKLHAWGHDELAPLSLEPRDWHDDTLLMTQVDSLDALIILGLDEEAARTKADILNTLSFDKDITVKVFEITIRLLGGLLSAHQLTGDPKLLVLAEDLGTRLLPAFDSPTGMPYRFINLKTGETSGAETNPAEVGTLMLEFGTLGRLTKRDEFYDRAKRALVALYDRRAPTTGLVGDWINVETGEYTGTTSHIGGGIDSYYEYLLKCERLFGDPDCGAMWKDSVAAVHAYLADEVNGSLWYGEADMVTGKRTATTYGALHAFFPAVLALGGDLERARRLQDSGFRMWTLAGIEPEELDYSTMTITSGSYQLRPEFIESAYYLFHYTKDPRYQQMGLAALDSLVARCRTDSGYATLRSVETGEKGDRMHSFVLTETFKYLYLLFEPSAVDFDAVVFTTEAHPLRRTW